MNKTVGSCTRERKSLDQGIRRLWGEMSDLRTHPPSRRDDLLWNVKVSLSWLETYTRELREEMGMANKKVTENGWIGFVDVTLTSDEKELFGAWDIHDEDLWLLLVDAMVGGHKVSLSYNKQNETFGASFTGVSPDGENKGYTLSAFAADWYTAVRVLMFKHSVILHGVWENARQREGERIG